MRTLARYLFAAFIGVMVMGTLEVVFALKDGDPAGAIRAGGIAFACFVLACILESTSQRRPT